MAQTVADVVLSRLRQWGVRQVFAYPGDGINGLLAAWGRADNHPQFVQARHEEMAALEAVGYAKFSGNVGVCAATSGPGAVHLLNGLYDAKLDHVQVVAIVGQTARSAMGGAGAAKALLGKDVLSDELAWVTGSIGLPFTASQTLPDVDYAAFARSLGMGAVNIDDPDALGPAWDEALSASRPTVLDIRCDPDVPPIPPHSTFEQAKATARSILHGDEDRWGFVREGVKMKASQVLSGRRNPRRD
jgi:thiamine pyrophosphate-dependent acetolactate synthase large subunit-like protein